jgi:hypothetical protein
MTKGELGNGNGRTFKEKSLKQAQSVTSPHCNGNGNGKRYDCPRAPFDCIIIKHIY